MSRYTISVITTDGNRAYLAPKGDGNYILKATLLGAAVWNSYEQALSARDAFFPDGSIRLLQTNNTNIVSVSRQELNNLERKING